MFTQVQANLFRAVFCTVGALAVSSVFLFAAAGPARAEAPGAAASTVAIVY